MTGRLPPSRSAGVQTFRNRQSSSSAGVGTRVQELKRPPPLPVGIWRAELPYSSASATPSQGCGGRVRQIGWLRYQRRSGYRGRPARPLRSAPRTLPWMVWATGDAESTSASASATAAGAPASAEGAGGASPHPKMNKKQNAVSNRIVMVVPLVRSIIPCKQGMPASDGPQRVAHATTRPGPRRHLHAGRLRFPHPGGPHPPRRVP